MHTQPNPEHTSMVFREFIMGHLLGWGNFFAQVIIDKRGDVQELWPLRPDRMSVRRFEGVRIYTYTTAGGKPRIFLPGEVLHIPAFGFDGLVGYSRIAMARNAIGLAMSLDKYASKYFANGGHPGLLYKHPGQLSEDAYDRLQTSLDERSGLEHSHKGIILEEGLDIARIGLPNDDSQFLDTKKFSVLEIARIFRVPPHMIGEVSGSTSWGSGIDSQEQGYVNHTLRPWATRTEQNLNVGLLPKDMQESFYYEHLMDGLLRGDIQTRFAAYVSAINSGFMSRNEARERENMNPRKGLDDMLQPLNMTTVTSTTTGGGGAVDGSDQSAESPLAPLWAAAIDRAMTRERNDLTGAAKRWLEKGNQKDFNAWAERFYSVDHVAFFAKQLQPIHGAHFRLYGTSNPGIDAYIADYLDMRRQAVKTMSAGEIESNTAQDLQNYAADLFYVATLQEPQTMQDEESVL